ncbi:MAG: hypothetical protein GY841_05580, partial [FCB group bacterium]|nr:hypothetical protein [FCB group bacterium]
SASFKVSEFKPTISHKQIAAVSVHKVCDGSLGLIPAHFGSGHIGADVTEFGGEAAGDTVHAVGTDEILTGLLKSHGGLEVTWASVVGLKAASEVDDIAVLDKVLTGLLENHGGLEVTWASILGGVSIEVGSEATSADNAVSARVEGGNLIAVVSGLTVEDSLRYSHVGSSWVAKSEVIGIVGLSDGAGGSEVGSTHSEGVSLEWGTDSVVVRGECGGTHGHNVTLEWLADGHVRADMAGGTDLHLGAVERSSHGHNVTLEWLADGHVRANMAWGAD